MRRTTRRHQGSARLIWLSPIGCVLLALLWVAAGSAAAGASKSAAHTAAPASQQLESSLVVSSLEKVRLLDWLG